ncbi:YadA-like family protein [Xenorhabdus hominickii]|uniref:Trimeric autotransporter adhesin YadA-like C-terminal membrane anchor domain-containing protein n=1 Tax=Xenorhabdus hominickii TaxID=351679 RepID=A0A2G0QFR5_XENHO|nr:YadA C-terminal domain-containing protein [Xenorhabdus hominickii]AOM42069.1 hypothetical protein A9255_16795 [Xenorhabdus hominickii]PHM58064.1 hypothetical protein Xhom_01071 [Xenorhabdus hominickii]
MKIRYLVTLIIAPIAAGQTCDTTLPVIHREKQTLCFEKDGHNNISPINNANTFENSWDNKLFSIRNELKNSKNNTLGLEEDIYYLLNENTESNGWWYFSHLNSLYNSHNNFIRISLNTLINSSDNEISSRHNTLNDSNNNTIKMNYDYKTNIDHNTSNNFKLSNKNVINGNNTKLTHSNRNKNISGDNNTLANSNDNKNIKGNDNTLTHSNENEVQGDKNHLSESKGNSINGHKNNLTNADENNINGNNTTLTHSNRNKNISGDNNTLANSNDNKNIKGNDNTLTHSNENEVQGDKNHLSDAKGNNINGNRNKNIRGNNNILDNSDDNKKIIGNENRLEHSNENDINGDKNYLSDSEENSINGSVNQLTHSQKNTIINDNNILISAVKNKVLGSNNTLDHAADSYIKGHENTIIQSNKLFKDDKNQPLSQITLNKSILGGIGDAGIGTTVTEITSSIIFGHNNNIATTSTTAATTLKNTVALNAKGIAGSEIIAIGGKADGDHTITLGAGSSSTNGGIAFGENSKATRADELNIGQRQITGVKTGTEDNHIINIKQLNNRRDNTLTQSKIYVEAGITALPKKIKTQTDTLQTQANKHTNDILLPIKDDAKKRFQRITRQSIHYTDTQKNHYQTVFEKMAKNYYVDTQFDQLNRYADKQQKRINAGISAAMAATAIPSKNSNKLSVGFGIASYRGQAAGAVGSILTVSPHIQIKVAMTYDTQSGTGLNSGITIGF